MQPACRATNCNKSGADFAKARPTPGAGRPAFSQLYKASPPRNGAYTQGLHTCFQLDAQSGIRHFFLERKFSMKFAVTPFTSFNRLVLAGLLAATGASAMAQGAPTAPIDAAPAYHYGEPMSRMGRHDPAKMQA